MKKVLYLSLSLFLAASACGMIIEDGGTAEPIPETVSKDTLAGIVILCVIGLMVILAIVDGKIASRKARKQ